MVLATPYTRKVSSPADTSVTPGRQRFRTLLLSSGMWRLVRFGVMGGITFGVQIGLLMLLTQAGLPSMVAYTIGLVVAVQFNFLVNQFFVWDDRRIGVLFSRAMAERWLTFHGCIALSLVLNLGGFAVAHLFMPDLPAAIIGVGLSTLVKFFSLDRLAFKDA